MEKFLGDQLLITSKMFSILWQGHESLALSYKKGQLQRIMALYHMIRSHWKTGLKTRIRNFQYNARYDKQENV